MARNAAFNYGSDIPLERVTGAIPTIETNHAFIHDGVAYTASGTISIANTKSGGLQITTPVDTKAAVTVNMNNANADLTYTAVAYGAAGNSISVVHVDPAGNNKALAVSVAYKTITVSLATGAGGAITSTANQVVAAIAAHSFASALVTCAAEGTGLGVVNAANAASLTGGADTVYVHLKAETVGASGGPVTVTLLEDNTFADAGTAVTPANRKRSGTVVASKLVCKKHTDVTAVAGAGSATLHTDYIAGATTGAVKIGGAVGAAEEWILKPGTNYLWTFANTNGNTVVVSFDMFWYEESGA